MFKLFLMHSLSFIIMVKSQNLNLYDFYENSNYPPNQYGEPEYQNLDSKTMLEI